MIEYVKYNCHVMARNDVGNKTPEILMNEYISKRQNGTDFIFDDVECVVTSVNYASGKSNIITKISRKDDLKDESVCSE